MMGDGCGFLDFVITRSPCTVQCVLLMVSCVCFCCIAPAPISANGQGELGEGEATAGSQGSPVVACKALHSVSFLQCIPFLHVMLV